MSSIRTSCWWWPPARSTSENKPQFYAVIKDESGNTVQEFEIEDGAVDTVKPENGLCTATLVLDNLSTGKNLRFGQQERFNKLIPGENLTVTIRVKDEKNNQIQGTSKTVTTNSLFAEVRDDASGIGGTGRTAVIKYGRHLQNLEENSGLNRGTDSKTPAITAAVQERDIQFKSDESDSWGVLYPKRNFVPLVNSQINSYHSKIGSYCPVIYDLTVDVSGDAGLFKTFAGELKNIRLAGAQITGKQIVGTGPETRWKCRRSGGKTGRRDNDRRLPGVPEPRQGPVERKKRNRHLDRRRCVRRSGR